VVVVVLLASLVRCVAQDLTIPEKGYSGEVSFADAPRRASHKFPLSDQENEQGWALVEDLSDEFHGPDLNATKWHRNNPKWKGRPPTLFHGSNVSVEDGELVLRLNQHGDAELPDGFTHTSGFVKSRKRMLYGYVEAEMKLMNATWVSGFWMTNVERDWWTEIDICENCPGVAANRHDLNSNVHVFRAPPDKGNVTEHFSISRKFRVPFELQADYHVWGLEWDKDHIRFYLDGVLFREQPNTHWHQPLEINLNCESNKWFGALPDDAGVHEQFRVRYFRAWRKAEPELQ
jgi:beta-glucanase (GH16 family)